jgi:L-malate glycosyltransferase
VPDRLRVLVAGWLNSPHVVAWVEAVAAAGHEVHLAGRAAPQWPESEVEAAVHRLPAGGPPLLRGLRMSRELANVAGKIRPDLVHAHWLPEFGWMASREGLRPLVCSAWGSDVLVLRGEGRRRSKKALDGADLVLASSKHLAEASRALAGRDVRVEVVRWGLDFERFSPGDRMAARETLGLDRDGSLIVSVRGFDGVYNPELLLDAFARIKAVRPDAQLVFKHTLSGVPPEIEAAVDRFALDGSVTLLGRAAGEMPDVYRAADVVVSLSSSDSSPRSVWEALACGRPVVISDLPWARDELTPDRHALFVPLEASSVADAVTRVLGDATLSRRLEEEARARALAELDFTASAQRIDALYRSVLKAAR